MKKEPLLSTMLLLVVSLFACPVIMEAEEVNPEKPKPKAVSVGAGEMGVEAVIIEGAPIKADQVLTPDHPPYGRGMVCVECPQVTFDTITSSTKQFIRNYPQLPNDEVWKRIEDFLPGREGLCSPGQIYGLRYTATLYGLVFLGHQIGSFIGVWIGGWTFERTGSYDLVWWLGIGLALAAAALSWPIDESPVQAQRAAGAAH